MGYQRKRKVFKLKFTDPEMEGLEVRAGSPSMAVFVAISNMSGQRVSTAELDEMLVHFCESLIDWNLEDENDAPVPANIDGLRSQDPEFVLDIIDAWMDAVQGTDNAPLAQPSQDGEQSLEASIPMETPSESRAS